MKTKCIRYNVNPLALKQGVSVDQLEKFNIREFNPTPEEQENLFKRPNSKSKNSPIPVVDERPVIELSSIDYYKALSRQAICASEDILVHSGKKIKIVNSSTGAHVIRTLVMIGDNTAYFA